MARRIILIGLLVLICPLEAFSSEIVGKIVALVDDKVITQSDVSAAYAKYAHIKHSGQKGILQELINEKVMEAEFEREKINISEDEVERAIQEMLTQKGIALDKLQDELVVKGQSLVTFREGVRQDLARSQFFQKVIYPRIRFSDIDLQDYYKRNAKQYSGVEKIRFLEIMLTPESLPAGTDLQAESLKLAAQLKKGGSFAEAARLYSRGGFAANGGDSGLLATKDIRPDLLETLLKLKPNTVSDPIPAGNNFFIFKVVETVTPRQRSFNEVKESLRQTYISERMKDELDRFLVEARSRHHIEIR